MDPLEQLAFIRRAVRALAPRGCDLGDVTTRVWTECRERGILPTFRHVRWRVWEWLRQRERERRALRERALVDERHNPRPARCSGEVTQLLDAISTRAGLSDDEVLVLYLRFYEGKALRDLARSLDQTLDRVEFILSRALSKLRTSAKDLFHELPDLG